MNRLRRALVTSLAAPLLLASAGCMSTEFGYHLGDHDHPWHSVPWLVTGVVTFVPMLILYAPVPLFVEGADNTHTEPFTDWVTFPACVVGSAFYVAGFPLELVFVHDEPPPPEPEPEPETPPPLETESESEPGVSP